MLDELQISNLKEQYHDNIANYYIYLDFINAMLKRYLKESKIDYNLIESRVKSFDSLINKIEKKKNKYANPFSEITDMIGIRIVTYYREDVDVIVKILFKYFDIDYKNSVNKLVNLEPDRMGYLSVHYVCQPKREFLSSTEKRFSDLDIKVEIQIRTALQHAWAAIDHKLRYKTLVKIPKKIERKLFRISALLEVADSEFSKIKDEITAIEGFYKQKISNENYHIRLDLSTVSFYLNFNDKLVLNTIEKLQVFHYNSFDIAKEEKLEKKLLSYSLEFGINKIEDLHKLLTLIRANQNIFYKYLDEVLKEKLRYLINSACTFFITVLMVLYEDLQELKRIYKLSDESINNIIKIRKELIN